MNIVANGENESPDEEKDYADIALGERGSLARVGEMKINANHGAATSRSQGSGVVQVHQQQPTQGSVVCWERFLHVRSIRVLLVENDDSTRHVVTALLRNCNYEVVDAANGLQAWKILEDLNNHIDIVLTEVVMPCFSGIGLLCKIMSHKTRKTIPVIMMSSHDSMGLVFKCLSKGAVDFLLKPIRKNELKNLWQHVWRRCQSSSGSGSESGTQTQKSVKSKGTDILGNSASDDGENNESNGLNAGDGSDDGSGAQSSWTKRAVEVDSSQSLSPIDNVAQCPDSTCAQVIHSNAEHSDCNRVQLRVAREGHGQQLPDAGNELDIVPKSENPGEGQANPTGRESESTREVANKLDTNSNANATDDCKEPNVELSLKRLRGVQETGGSVQDEQRYVLRRSEQSAFSRYNTSISNSKSPIAITGSSSVLDNSNGAAAAKREYVGEMQILSTDHIMYQNSNGIIGNNIDMGSTTFRLPPNTHHQDFHNPHHHFQNMDNNHQPLSNHEEPSVKQLALDGPVDVNNNNTVNCSLNRSGSGSNHGSNGQNGSCTAINNAVGNNGESDAGQAGKSGSGGDASGTGSGNKADEIRFTQREAALLKFRQKRKERCFKKKVRYQTRKKLAEQRPRVRGQFVKQPGTDSSNRSGDE
ncbi:Two-component response regulator-like APRR7 [Striga hermonthica]|uniref:Two-component response regulator-like APRR7 n=1 Tax=Striga hermonthica TaxID=68872 RepID=A0A9N7NJY4_STRHE|nr:Two-component response regulator-like APRR7 [Striga hermonthica]